MYYHYIMKQVMYPNRTQISLPNDLKSLIEAYATKYGESLSEYVRKAALVRMVIDDADKRDLERIANAVIGSVPKTKSGWKNIKDIAKWQSNLRKDEDVHRFKKLA